MIREKVWSSQAGLAYAQQVPDAKERLDALLQVATLLCERGEEAVTRDAVTYALQLARQYHRTPHGATYAIPGMMDWHFTRQLSDEYRQIIEEDEAVEAIAWSRLVPLVSLDSRGSVLESALTAIKDILNVSLRAKALVALLPHLSAAQREYELDHTLQYLGGDSPGLSAQALVTLLPYLSALQVAGAMDEMFGGLDEDFYYMGGLPRLTDFGRSLKYTFDYDRHGRIPTFLAALETLLPAERKAEILDPVLAKLQRPLVPV